MKAGAKRRGGGLRRQLAFWCCDVREEQEREQHGRLRRREAGARPASGGCPPRSGKLVRTGERRGLSGGRGRRTHDKVRPEVALVAVRGLPPLLRPHVKDSRVVDLRAEAARPRGGGGRQCGG